MSIEIERVSAIIWARQQMAEHGLSVDDLAAAGCFPASQPPAPGVAASCYCNADGQAWDGQGAMPDWLQRAVNAGQTPEHFRVGQP